MDAFISAYCSAKLRAEWTAHNSAYDGPVWATYLPPQRPAYDPADNATVRSAYISANRTFVAANQSTVRTAEYYAFKRPYQVSHGHPHEGGLQVQYNS